MDGNEILLAFNDKGELEEVTPLTIFFDKEEEREEFMAFLKSEEFMDAFMEYKNKEKKE